MNFTEARKYLLSRPEAGEHFPFGPDVAVFKVAHKMFATLAEEADCGRMNLKCDPEQAVMLRDIFSAVLPGYHMNKRHWNTVVLDGSIPNGELERMIDHSFALVVRGLPKLERQGLEIRYGAAELYR